MNSNAAYTKAGTSDDAATHVDDVTVKVYNQQPSSSAAATAAAAVTVAPLPVKYLRHYPAFVECTNCNARVSTEVEHSCGMVTCLSCLFISLLGGVLGCCLAPLCIDQLKVATHKCPECHTVLHKHTMM